MDQTLILNERNGSSGEGGVSYEFTFQNISSSANSTPLEFRPSLQYLKYEQSYSRGWVQGPSVGISVHGLLGGSATSENIKYRLKGFRGGLRIGYKFRFWKLFVLEPNSLIQYGNLRIKETGSNNKIITQSLNFMTNLDTRFIIKMKNFQDIQIGFSTGYLFDPFDHSWKDSKKSNGSLSANDINLSGWYFGIQLLFIDPD